MKLYFTATASRHLIRLREFIAKKNPVAARKYSQQLIKQIKSLLKQPQLGTPITEEPTVRQLVARDYIVRYQVIESQLIVLKIWHGKEKR